MGLPGREAWAGEVGVLVAVLALESELAAAVGSSLDVLGVDVAVVALKRPIAGGMAVETPRMHEDFVDLEEGGLGVGGALGGGGVRRSARRRRSD